MDLYKLKYSLGYTLFTFSSIIFIIVFIELFILNVSIQLGNLTFMTFGYPWPSERVMAYTTFIKMPNFSNSDPNVYFLNYGEMIILSLVSGVIGVNIMEKNLIKAVYSGNNYLSIFFLILFLIFFTISLIAFIKIQVLEAIYYIDGTLYYPYNNGWIINYIITHYNLHPIKVLAYYGGDYGTEKIPKPGISWDDLFLLSGFLSSP